LRALGPSSQRGQSFWLTGKVTPEELPSGSNVEDCEAPNESGLGLLFTGYRRLRTDRLLIGSYPAVVRYYTWKRGDGVELYQLQLVTLAGSRGYVVTGTTTTASTRLANEAKLLVSILLTFRPK